MGRSLLILVALGVLPSTLPAQGQTLSGDAATVVDVALRYARHDLIAARKHVSVDRWINEVRHGWSASQAEAFRGVLAAGDSAHAGIELCDSREHRCRLDDSSEVVQIFAPELRGDTATVMIYRQRWQTHPSPRVRWSLQGNQYVLARRGAHWVVVRSDHLVVT